MSGGKTTVQIKPRMEGRLNAAVKRMEEAVSEPLRMIVKEGLERPQGGTTNPLNESILGRIQVTRFHIEEMSARSFDPTFAESIGEEIKVNALDSYGRNACFW